jgi:hypothetical protein
MRILLVLFISMMACQAQALTELEFSSGYDRFTLQKDGARYLLGGRAVDLGTFKEFLPLFDRALEGSCERVAKLKPDLILRRVEKDSQGKMTAPPVVRNFYVTAKIVGDGKECAAVAGVGISYIPLHASWFSENAKGSADLDKNFSLEKDGKVLGRFKYEDDEWTDAVEGQYLNWDFMERFIKSLEKFPIDFRLHPSIAEGKLHFSLKVGDQTYQFYKVDKNLWAMKSPRLAWLLSSKSWAFWENFDPSLFEEPFTDRIQKIFDPNLPLAERESSLKSLDRLWSVNIRRALHKLLTDPRQEKSLRDLALQILKKRPSLENIKVFIQALKQTDDVDFQSDLTKTLRVRNPKGPIIQPEDTDEQRAKAVEEWTRWWKKLAPAAQ